MYFVNSYLRIESTTRRHGVIAARTMANSIDNTNTANASSMVLSSSSSAAIATSMANDEECEYEHINDNEYECFDDGKCGVDDGECYVYDDSAGIDVMFVLV